MSYEESKNIEQSGCLTMNAVINDSDFPTDGDHNFIITNIESGIFPGSEKMEKCATVTVSMSVRDGVCRVPAKIRLFISRSNTWRLAAFFRCIGLKKRGEAFEMDWSRVVGQRGRACFATREYTDKHGETRTVSDISKFYDFDEEYFADDEKVTFVDLSDDMVLPF